MTALRMFGALIVLVILIGAAANFAGRAATTTSDDPGRRVTISVTVKPVIPGAPKPLVHYRQAGFSMDDQMRQESHIDGIPVDNDGHYRRSLGYVRRGTWINAWVTDLESEKHPLITLQIIVEGNTVGTGTNERRGDLATCSVEVV